MKSKRAKTTRAKKSFQEAVKGAKLMEKDASYVGELTSGYDATTPGIDGAQKGKDHQEAVNEGGKTVGGAHHDDKRDEVGRASDNGSLRKVAKDLRIVAATLSRAAERMGSYVGELTSGYDATTPGIDGGQKGKDHQEAVNEGGKTDGGAHHDDKRDEVGRAAQSEGMKKLGESLLTLEKEAKDGKLTDIQQSTLADTFKQLGRDFDNVLDSAGALEGEYKSDAEILVCSGDQQVKKDAADDDWISVTASDESDEWIDVEAAGHPAEDATDRLHTQFEGRPVDQPSMTAEQWFELGPGTFEDPRDKVEKATAKGTADHFS